VLGIVAVLMIMQPHISGLIIMCGITFIMMLISGTNLKYLGAGILGGGGLMYLIAKTMGHSSSRLQVWEDPFSYLLEGGWQPAQSLYAIGSGGFWGVGFGNSRQKHLYLPEPQNDYIFSIWCEEMGFVGAVIVICIFMFFIYRGLKIGINAPNKFSSMLVIGIISHVGLQMLLNIAVVTNSLPSTGISLPFFSYGGTSILILLAEMGIVLSVSKYSSLENTR
jgi:cell division protein FtsW